MGKKYIIDLNPDCVDGEYLRIPARIAGEEQWLVTKAALTPYTEPDTNEAYQRGAEDMRKALRLLIDCDDDCLTNPDIFKAFGEGSYHAVVRKHPAMEILEKIRQYEQEQIQVGDEVISPDGKGVVTEINDRIVRIMYSNGSGYVTQLEELTKTGRHFPEIAAVLAKMKEES